MRQETGEKGEGELGEEQTRREGRIKKGGGERWKGVDKEKDRKGKGQKRKRKRNKKFFKRKKSEASKQGGKK